MKTSWPFPSVTPKNDFVTDRLEDGRRFRVLTIIDQYHRYSPALVPALSFSGARVVEDSIASPGLAGTLDRLPVTMARSSVHGLSISGRIYTGYGLTTFGQVSR
jgi:hypothetical protein